MAVRDPYPPSPKVTVSVLREEGRPAATALATYWAWREPLNLSGQRRTL